MMDGEQNLQWRVVGDDVVVLDEARREVHRLHAASAASIVDGNGMLTRRRLIAAAAAGIVITTVALPSAAAAASNDGVLDSSDTPAATPTGVAASSGGATSIFVSWNPMNEVSGYYVIYGTSNPPTTQLPASTSALTITGLDPGTQYFVQVFAWNDASPLPAGGPRSGVVTATTDAAPTSIDALATTAEVSDGTLTVSWTDGVSATTTYTVYWRETGTSAWGSKPNATSPTAITGLLPGSTYDFYVARLRYGLESPAPATPEVSPPIPVPSVTGSATVGDRTLTITWAPAAPRYGYKLYWRRTGASSWNVVSPATSPTEITGLDAGFTYDYYVAATLAAPSWESPAPATPSVSAFLPVPSVTGFAAGSNITDAAPGVNLKGFTWMRLKWDAVTGTSPTYQVQRLVSSVWTNEGSPTASTSAVVTGLTNNTSQQFRIVTIINGNSSSGSSSSSDTTHRVPTVTGTGNAVTQLGTAPDLIWECNLIASGSVTTYGPTVATSYLVVGGGGGGGGGRSVGSPANQRVGGGGGGGGGVVTGSTSIGAGTYTVTIGPGGVASTAGSGTADAGRGGNGTASSLALATSVSAAGGGGGGGASVGSGNRSGNAGGCGGGAGAGTTVSAAGGAGSAGGNGASTSATAGAAAGGAGGGAGGTPGTAGATGKTWATADGGDNKTYGAGGAAGPGSNSNGTAGGANTGQGGSGGGGERAGGTGGSGIVIVRVSEYAR